MNGTIDSLELWHLLYVNLLYRETHPDGHSCKYRSVIELKTDENQWNA
jgi:hypothetical protein